MLEAQYEEESSVNPLYNFWLSVNDGLEKGDIVKGYHYKVEIITDEQGDKIDCFRFRFDKLYSNYKKQQKGLGININNPLLEDYEIRGLIKREDYYIGAEIQSRFKLDAEDVNAYKERTKKEPKSSQPTTCVAIDLSKLKERFDIDVEAE